MTSWVDRKGDLSLKQNPHEYLKKILETLTEDERKTLGSKTLASVILRFTLEMQAHHSLDSKETLESLRSAVKGLDEQTRLYEENYGSKAVVSTPIGSQSAGAWHESATSLRSAKDRVSELDTTDKANEAIDEQYRDFRAAIVNFFNKTGGIPLPPKFRERLIEYGDSAIRSGDGASILDSLPEVFEKVLDIPDTPIADQKPTLVVKERIRRGNRNKVVSWDQILPDNKSNDIRLHSMVLNHLVEQDPIFTDIKNVQEGKRRNLLEAALIIFALDKNEFQEFIKRNFLRDKNRKPLMAVARILSIRHALDTGERKAAEEFVETARKLLERLATESVETVKSSTLAPVAVTLARQEEIKPIVTKPTTKDTDRTEDRKILLRKAATEAIEAIKEKCARPGKIQAIPVSGLTIPQIFNLLSVSETKLRQLYSQAGLGNLQGGGTRLPYIDIIIINAGLEMMKSDWKSPILPNSRERNKFLEELRREIKNLLDNPPKSN